VVTVVTLLTKPDCSLCDDAKSVLQELSDEFGFAVETVDVNTERGQRLAWEANMVFPPGVLVDGQPFSYGRLSKRKLRLKFDALRVAAT
jgi:glutaredoxin